MSTSVHVGLDREGEAACGPGCCRTQVRIVGGNWAAPVVEVGGLRLAKR